MIPYSRSQLKLHIVKTIMSLNLSNVILHQLTKNEQDELQVEYRSETLPTDSSTEHLVAELHRVFNAKGGKAFGTFAEESEFKQWLGELSSQTLDFYTFSQQSAERLKKELAKYPFADAGTFILAQYQSLATNYLFIGLLPTNSSLKVTEGLSISATDYLDITKMDIAARIDLSTYEMDPSSNRYLTYVKGRVGRKVADFFMDFLQAEAGLDPKMQNQVLMQAVEDFVADEKLEKEEAIAYRKQVADYCGEQIKAGEEIEVKELSFELPASSDGTSFADFTQEQGYDLEESFPGDRTAVRKLTKYVGAGGGLNISFDSLLLGERVHYDPQTDTLTIKGTPPNLKDQLTRKG